METVQIITLGVVQGITEFLPISSSGHLILVPYLLDWPLQSLNFDVALHLGTLIALLYCFWGELFDTLKSREMLTSLVIATIPAALAGLFLENVIELYARSPLVVVFNLILIALVMYYTDKKGKQTKTTVEVTRKNALIIGLAQALALFPGVSRSGITIAAGLGNNLDRVSAARFSFLIGIPIIAGAGALKSIDLLQNPGGADLSAMGLGILVSALVGVVAIKYLLRFLKSHTLQIFVFYRIILGLVLLFLLL